MENSLSEQVTQCIDRRQRQRHGRQVLMCLAVVVVFCTVYALMMPAVTMSNQVTCGKEAHVHTEDCWTVELSGPQPELICDAMNYRGVVIHQHNSYCYDSHGELICTLPEIEAHTHGPDCYQELRELVCTEVQEVGHTHSAACWAYDRGDLICDQEEGGDSHTHTDSCYQTESRRVLSCTTPESEPHTHDSSCYTTKTQRELTCSLPESDDVLDEEGNVIEAGHRHSSSCYTEHEETVLTCSLQESEGHTHDDSCYTTEEERVLICGLTETQGHEHGDSCYEWTQRLICQEEERPAGHVHTDACYEITPVLACRKQELVPHTHDDSCYGEEGGLLCSKPEAIVHEHTAACVHIPEGGLQELRVLTCGKEEHQHTDACYVDLTPKEDEGYFCGIVGHVHSDECYFEDGTLRCTLPEHIHTLACMQENPEPPVEPEKPTGLWLAEDYEFENEEFHLTFHINGYASIVGAEDGLLPSVPGSFDQPVFSGGLNEPAVPNTPDISEELPDPEPTPAPTPDPELVVVEPVPEPEPEFIPDPTPIMTVELDPLFNYDYDAPTIYEDSGVMHDAGDGGVTPPSNEALISDDGESISVSRLSTGWQDTAAGGSTSAQVAELNSSDVEFSVEFRADSTSYENLAVHTEELSEEEILLLRVLTLTATIDGQELDLSNCTVEVEVTLTDAMLAALADLRNAQPLGISMSDEALVDGDDQTAEMSLNLTLAAYSNEEDGGIKELKSITVDTEESAANPPVMTFSLPQGSDPTVALSLLKNVYPVFTVEYYARIKHPATGGGAYELPFIDTSSEANGGTAKLPVNGTMPKVMNLQLNADGTVLFDQNLEPERLYADKKFQFNPNEEELTVRTLMGMKDNTHYDLKEMWVLRAGVDPEEATEEDWTVYTDWENLRFTNNLKVDGKQTEDGKTIVAIQEGTVFRLVYDQATGVLVNENPGFYDYDISGGPNNSLSVNTVDQGINSRSNLSQGTTGVRLSFGNANTGTGLGTEMWNGNYLNTANRDPSTKQELGYKFCTFGLVQGFTGSDVIYSNGITGPKLFGGDTAVGKTSYDDFTLEFKSEGDTHTLTAVKQGGSTILSNLDSFHHPDAKYQTIWTNSFWPMDGEYNTDPHFGKAGTEVKFNDTNYYFPVSDDFKNHNSYFGMTFTVNFTLSEEYQGPLEYYFYGDDDMWVFLNDELVCDIGGVHSSVGEYVDLWDYIPGGRMDHKDGTYTMTVFYTERGASGSTCWLQYTLPNAIFVPSIITPNQENTPLIIKKLVSGNLVTEELAEQEYTFSLKLTKRFESYQATIYDEKNQPKAMKFDEETRLWEYDAEKDNDLSADKSFWISGEEEAVQFHLKDGWYLKIADLSNSAGYVVDEIFPDGVPEGCTTTVQTTIGGVEGETVSGTHAEDTSMGSEDRVITYTNSFNFELPETGGSGTAPYALAGGLLTAAALWLWYKRKTAGERGAASR